MESRFLLFFPCRPSQPTVPPGRVVNGGAPGRRNALAAAATALLSAAADVAAVSDDDDDDVAVHLRYLQYWHNCPAPDLCQQKGTQSKESDGRAALFSELFFLSPISRSFLLPRLAFEFALEKKTHTHTRQHKNLLKHAKGYRGKSKNCYTVAVRRVEKAWEYAYRDRRRKKREYRKLWIMRVQAACRQYGWSYSRFVPALGRAGSRLNRKVLAELAANEPFAFRSVVSVVERHAAKSDATSTNSNRQRRQRTKPSPPRQNESDDEGNGNEEEEVVA